MEICLAKVKETPNCGVFAEPETAGKTQRVTGVYVRKETLAGLGDNPTVKIVIGETETVTA